MGRGPGRRRGRSQAFPGNCSMLTFPFPDNLSQFRPFVFKAVQWAPLHSPVIPPKEEINYSFPSDFCVSQDSSVSLEPAKQSGAKVFLASSPAFLWL